MHTNHKRQGAFGYLAVGLTHSSDEVPIKSGWSEGVSGNAGGDKGTYSAQQRQGKGKYGNEIITQN